MLIPRFPTDNLYKFMAFFGLVLIIIAFIPGYFLHRVQMDIIKVEGKIKKYNFVSDRIDEDLNHMDNQIEKFEKLHDSFEVTMDKVLSQDHNANDQNVKDQNTKDLIESRTTSRVLTAISDDLSEKLPMVYDKLWNNTILKISNETENNILKYQLRMIVILFCISIALGISGIIVSIYGFKKWYSRLQKYQDKIVKQEAIKKES